MDRAAFWYSVLGGGLGWVYMAVGYASFRDWRDWRRNGPGGKGEK